MSATADALTLGVTRRRIGWNPGWGWLPLLLCVPTLIPLAAAGGAWWSIDPDTLRHLMSSVLPQAASNTLWLLGLVLVGVCVVGISTAALIALTDFPGRRVFSFALLLPLAMPGYVLAIAYIGMLDYSGPVASALRTWGITAPEFRNRFGVAAVLTASLFPYVYLITREALAGMGLRAIEAARSVGMSPVQATLKVGIPMAAPWIAAGASLAMMETLADFGTVYAFNYDTLSVAIYKAWYGLFSPQAALQIASVMIAFVLILLVLESLGRRRMRYDRVGHSAVRRLELSPVQRWLAFSWCGLILMISFGIPGAWLVGIGMQHAALLTREFASWALNSAALAAMAAIGISLIAGLMAASAHARPSWAMYGAQRVSTLGYAFPGALLAVGLYVPIHTLANHLGMAFPVEGGLALLLTGYMVRFMAAAHAPLAASTGRIPRTTLDAARLTGLGRRGLLRRIYWPAMRGGTAVAATLVFVDVMKEMPITLMMRPFGWDTLATRVFEYTSEGQWDLAAVPALAIVIVGMVPVWLIQRSGYAMKAQN